MTTLRMFQTFRKKRIYLDHAAATPISRRVLSEMQPFLGETFGNPSAIHREGMDAHAAVENARTELARILQVRPEGVVFTGNGTESNNLAILGRIAALHKEGISYANMEVISTRTEHPSITETLAYLSELGVRITSIDVDSEGRIDHKQFSQAITHQTVLCTFAYVNSEIGVIQHVGKLSRVVREKEKEFGIRIYVHVDAAQAPLWLSCELERLGVDLISLDAGKCGGPKGVGVLAWKQGVTLSPIYFGGEQERGLRPGTESPALIVGASAALVEAQTHCEENTLRITLIRDHFIKKLLTLDGVVLNGHRTERVANNVNISIPGIDSEFAVVVLDQKGIACSTKSACGGAKGDGSSVVRVMSNDDARARSTIRFTLGPDTTVSDIDTTCRLLTEHVNKMRAFSKSLKT
jgi:cysteine desulfurase